MSGPGFIAAEPPQTCELCGKFAECRPYGPNREQICHACGNKDAATTAQTERKMREYLFGEKLQ
jgi:hypothetical protein